MSDKPTPIPRQKFYKALPKQYNIPEQDLQPYQKDQNIDANYGKPNIVRGNQTSNRENTVKNFKISLEDNDAAINYYLINKIKPTIELNGENIQVPVYYGSPERWKSIQKDGYYRDKNGKLLSPVIVFKRESFEKNRNLGNKLDGNKANNIQYFKSGWSKRNQYDNFNVLNNQVPQESYQGVVIPDYITIRYKIIIFTDFVEHTNKIIEGIEYASDSYWGDKEKFLFRTRIDSYPTPVTVETQEDRVSKSELILSMQGYIIPDNINVNESLETFKSFNFTKVIVKEKIV